MFKNGYDYFSVISTVFTQHTPLTFVSWGPEDDGGTVDGPKSRTLQALQEGAERGRGGLGSIFVWATGA